MNEKKWKKIGGPSHVAGEEPRWSVEGLECDFMFLRHEADADLIAAAPDLLEALQELYDDQQGALTEAMVKARAALAKTRQKGG